MASFAARLDDVPRAMWFALAILGFMFWWPLDSRCWDTCYGAEKWDAVELDLGAGATIWTVNCRAGGRSRRTSGNQAFDEYRTATLQRLEEEQREFRDFLSRLRMAKDKAEFDQFMAERRIRPEPTTS